jgi:hypothetical protein
MAKLMNSHLILIDALVFIFHQIYKLPSCSDMTIIKFNVYYAHMPCRNILLIPISTIGYYVGTHCGELHVISV